MPTHYGPQGDFHARRMSDDPTELLKIKEEYEAGLERIRKHQEWMETDSRFAVECPDLDNGVTDADMKFLTMTCKDCGEGHPDDEPCVRSTISGDRKQYPLARGLLDYFPKALAEVAHCSRHCNEQHNKGEPMHWAREKSTDEADCLLRHLVDRGNLDTDGIRHSAKVAWRALALLERELDGEKV